MEDNKKQVETNEDSEVLPLDSLENNDEIDLGRDDVPTFVQEKKIEQESNEESFVKMPKKNGILIFFLILAGVIGGILVGILIGNLTKICEECEECAVFSGDSSDLDLAFLKMENKKQNMIYSPLSIKYALTMLKDGAEGETRNEIEEVLGGSDLRKYDNKEEILSLANSMFIKDGFEVKNDYKTLISEKYSAEIFNDSFGSPERINEWIKNKTFNMIPNAIPDGAISEGTRVALINALAIQMKWASEFSTDDTYGADFVKDDGTVIKATMMFEDENRGEDIDFYLNEDVTVVAKDLADYDGTQLEFVAIMPKSDLNSFVANLSSNMVNDLLLKTESASSTEYGVDLQIPKFKFDYELSDIKRQLQSMGIEKAFGDGQADFSKISDDEIFVSQVVHKANIDFSEEGLKAAAVTAMFQNLSMSITEEERPIEIKIDKPFFFEIRDKQDGAIWFVGTVYEPNLWENDMEEYSRTR